MIASKLSDLAIYYLNSFDIVVLDQISLPQLSMISQAAGATPKQGAMDLTIQGKYMTAKVTNDHDYAEEKFSIRYYLLRDISCQMRKKNCTNS